MIDEKQIEEIIKSIAKSLTVLALSEPGKLDVDDAAAKVIDDVRRAYTVGYCTGLSASSHMLVETIKTLRTQEPGKEAEHSVRPVTGPLHKPMVPAVRMSLETQQLLYLELLGAQAKSVVAQEVEDEVEDDAVINMKGGDA